MTRSKTVSKVWVETPDVPPLAPSWTPRGGRVETPDDGGPLLLLAEVSAAGAEVFFGLFDFAALPADGCPVPIPGYPGWLARCEEVRLLPRWEAAARITLKRT